MEKLGDYSFNLASFLLLFQEMEALLGVIVQKIGWTQVGEVLERHQCLGQVHFNSDVRRAQQTNCEGCEPLFFDLVLKCEGEQESCLISLSLPHNRVMTIFDYFFPEIF